MILFPSTIAAALIAASAIVSVDTILFFNFNLLPNCRVPRMQVTIGLGHLFSLLTKFFSVFNPGGFEINTMSSVFGSPSSSSRALKAERPPISSERSLLPVPIA